jgi:hypothetical protein
MIGIGGGVGDEEVEGGGVTEFLVELAAVATRSGGDGEVRDGRLGIEGEIGEEELFGVDGVVEREVWKLNVDAEEDAAGGSAEADGANVEVRDGCTGEALGRGD